MRRTRDRWPALTLLLLLAAAAGCGDDAEEGWVTIGAACAVGPCRDGLECIVNDRGAQICGKPCTTNADCEGAEVFDGTGLAWSTCLDCPGSPSQCVVPGSTCAATP